MRIAPLVLASLTLVLLAGCPTDNPTDPNATPTLSVMLDAPDTADAGDVITLTARVNGATDAAALQYQWYQTFGRVVSPDDANSPDFVFNAPALRSDQELRFRVDVTDAAGRLVSANAAVLVAKRVIETTDPNDANQPTFEPGEKPRVRVKTSLGDIIVELEPDIAPISVANFLRYVDDEFYDGTIFHRVIPDFVVQGGGFLPGLEQKETRDPIVLEDGKNFANDRGTIAMARTGEPDSGTSQFYFNLVDNDSLNRTTDRRGYAVFGRITDGIEVIDDIAAVPTGTQESFQDVPLEDVLIESIRRIDPNDPNAPA